MFFSRARFFLTSAGIGAAFFLTAALTGLIVGWCDTTSAIIRHSGVDVWLMADRTPAFDYGTPIPRNRIYQARSVEGVAWAEGMFQAFNSWQRPDGRKLCIELIGLDEGLSGGPWEMKAATKDVVHCPDNVIVDDLYLDLLGVRGVGDEVELLSRARSSAASRARSARSPPCRSSSRPSNPRSATIGVTGKTRSRTYSSVAREATARSGSGMRSPGTYPMSRP